MSTATPPTPLVAPAPLEIPGPVARISSLDDLYRLTSVPDQRVVFRHVVMAPRGDREIQHATQNPLPFTHEDVSFGNPEMRSLKEKNVGFSRSLVSQRINLPPYC